jgi:hypothetical protein
MIEHTFDDNPFHTEYVKGDWTSYLLEHLGERRFRDICRRMKVDPKKKLRERDVAKIIVCSSDLERNDLQEVLLGKELPAISLALREKIKGKTQVEDLSKELFQELFTALSFPFSHKLEVKKKESVEDLINQMWHFAYTILNFDPYWYTKKRLLLFFQNESLPLELYYERLSAFYVECEDLEVGCYIPAPSINGPSYYRVVGQLVTGKGQIGMFLLPATKDMDLPPIRVTRGTPKSPSNLDFLSHLITDMEHEIGKMGHESGEPYQPYIDAFFPHTYIEVGYSIGGVIAQWRAASFPERLLSIWLYKSPGVPRHVWEKFNYFLVKKDLHLNLHIFSAKRDFIDFAGECTLGYLAPKNLQVHLYQMKVPRPNPHRFGFVDPEKVQIKEIPPDKIDTFLNCKKREIVEKGRKKIGKHIAIPFFKLLCRWMGGDLSKRTREKIGFWHEVQGKNGYWTSTCYRIPPVKKNEIF